MNNSGFGHMRFFCELRLERNGKRNWYFSRTLLFYFKLSLDFIAQINSLKDDDAAQLI